MHEFDLGRSGELTSKKSMPVNEGLLLQDAVSPRLSTDTECFKRSVFSTGPTLSWTLLPLNPISKEKNLKLKDKQDPSVTVMNCLHRASPPLRRKLP